MNESRSEELTRLLTTAETAQVVRQYDRAIDLYQRALQKSREISDQDSTISALSHLGSLYAFLGRKDQATQALALALEEIERSANTGQVEHPSRAQQDT